MLVIEDVISPNLMNSWECRWTHILAANICDSESANVNYCSLQWMKTKINVPWLQKNSDRFIKVGDDDIFKHVLRQHYFSGCIHTKALWKSVKSRCNSVFISCHLSKLDLNWTRSYTNNKRNKKTNLYNHIISVLVRIAPVWRLAGATCSTHINSWLWLLLLLLLLLLLPSHRDPEGLDWVRVLMLGLGLMLGLVELSGREA